MPALDPFPPAAGTTIGGRWVVEEVLGKGGMGVVVAATHVALRRRMAIKLLRPEFALSPEVVTRFTREARAAASLRSEHVVNVVDVGKLDSGVPYFVMDYLTGMDLGTLVQKHGPLGVDDVVDFALQTLETLAEAHRAGIVHRDLKPSNLFLTTREDDSGLIKVLDFGISKLLGWEVTADGLVTREGITLGSPFYVSPEQIRDASRVDARTDIWSLGAVMHELITGLPPFPYQDIPRLLRAICTERYRLPERDDLPDALYEILFQCLRKERSERFQNAQELARAFQPLVRSASAQVSIERILRTQKHAPEPVRVTPVPERPSASTRPTPLLPSVTPTARDTPPFPPARGPFWVGARAGIAVGVVWAAYVLGSRLAHDDRAPAAPNVTAASAPAARTSVPAAAPPAVVAPPPAVVAPPVVVAKSSAPHGADAPLATREAPAERRLVARAPSPKRASEPAHASSASSETVPVGIAPAPVGPPREPFRRLRPLDENPFVKRP
jgi:serine/threonine protein kinase